jgi:hypothetical protein
MKHYPILKLNKTGTRIVMFIDVDKGIRVLDHVEELTGAIEMHNENAFGEYTGVVELYNQY